MPNITGVNLVYVPCLAAFTELPASGVNSASRWKKFRPQPFNVQSVENPRPSDGQIWPRGDGKGI